MINSKCSKYLNLKYINLIESRPKFMLPKLHQDHLREKKKFKSPASESSSYLSKKELDSGLFFLSGNGGELVGVQ